MKCDWWCDTCKIREPMTTEEFREHLAKVHGLVGPVRGQRKLIFAFDGDGFQNTYEWRLPGGIKASLVQYE